MLVSEVFRYDKIEEGFNLARYHLALELGNVGYCRGYDVVARGM